MGKRPTVFPGSVTATMMGYTLAKSRSRQGGVIIFSRSGPALGVSQQSLALGLLAMTRKEQGVSVFPSGSKGRMGTAWEAPKTQFITGGPQQGMIGEVYSKCIFGGGLIARYQARDVAHWHSACLESMVLGV